VQCGLIYNPAKIDFYNPDNFDIDNHAKNVNKMGSELSAVIEITTKKHLFFNRRPRYHFKGFSKLGYRLPVEFYSPRYDTPEARKNEMPDLRSTIYWKPDALLDRNGKTSVDFYTADSPTSYSIVIEGVCPDGTLIYQHRKAIINVTK
jgi:hypothetical protein